MSCEHRKFVRQGWPWQKLPMVCRRCGKSAHGLELEAMVRATETEYQHRWMQLWEKTSAHAESSNAIRHASTLDAIEQQTSAMVAAIHDAALLLVADADANATDYGKNAYAKAAAGAIKLSNALAAAKAKRSKETK